MNRIPFVLAVTLLLGFSIGFFFGKLAGGNQVEKLLREKQWFLNEHNRLVEEMNYLRRN